MCDVSFLYLSLSLPLLILCPLVVSRPPSSLFVCLFYFTHSFPLSICIRRESAGIRGTENFVLCCRERELNFNIWSFEVSHADTFVASCGPRARAFAPVNVAHTGS